MHRGSDRAFRTAVLPAGVSAKELSGSNEAAQFLETRQYQVIEICRAFRVPPHMIQDLTRSTYSNIEVQGTEFVQHCLLPHLKRWEAAISRDLLAEGDDERYFAEHSVSGLLRGDHASRSAYYVSALQNGWMSVNEIRELENMNPLGSEGDQHFIQMNMTTLEKAGEDPPAPEPMPAPPVAEVEDSPEDDVEDDQEDVTDGN
jgi:HK97 family phage portal protein